jgi:predicted ribosomally synthesized peptide with SipW-like signal peptide
MAIASVGLIVGIGTVATLAAWNDNEWVVGSTSGGAAGVGTSEFNVQQNRDQAPTALGSTWDDHQTEPAAGSLTFSLGALSLTPGGSTYAPVALKTTTESIAGTLTLQAPVPSTTITATDPGKLLWGAMQYSVKVNDAPTGCTATTWADFGTTVATDADFDGTLSSPPSQALSAAGGNIQYYCFKITLPAAPTGVTDLNTLQGLTAAPAWRFAATSAD